jgi:hypothetical protein
VQKEREKVKGPSLFQIISTFVCVVLISNALRYGAHISFGWWGIAFWFSIGGLIGIWGKGDGK